MLGIATLTTQEMELLQHIRANDFSEITIRIRQGVVVFLEGKKRVTSSPLHTLLIEKKYQTLEVMVEDGKIVNITQLIKQKL